MRARLLLYKQDELSVLESLIDQIDHEERSELFLSNRRRDRNAERLRVFKELDLALSSYGASFSSVSNPLIKKIPKDIRD